ncbi:exo-beta-N-acetylmuramidase NamZ domain-containing protein [Bizionia sediminis]|uniref:Exo-beta-N-acetylmuramidase NamZ domain-containing protein n=1 Tax=Bizionia sediminis TaxID=1737064 RepID=A0ABW5KU41_9FLAO
MIQILVNKSKNTVLLFVMVLISCGNFSQTTQEKNLAKTVVKKPVKTNSTPATKVGANQTTAYLPLLKNKRIGIVANQTSVIFKDPSLRTYTHLVDSLMALNVTVKKVFAPEHGFRGTADAGELIKDGTDTKTGLPLISLYGANKKPTAVQLQDLDLIIFDIQDVGARFYTYISTLHYVMEACAEQKIPLLILDRPNPNGHYIDGPILEPAFKSFVGMHPVPVVHGMTIAEYAKMINGEKWLENAVQCSLQIVPVANYTRQTPYSLPIKPSPNLPNDVAINLYPSLCFFEGTNVSAGRGTDKQFQIFGSPYLKTNSGMFTYQFTPQPNPGAKSPKHQDKLCYGMDLSQTKPLNNLNLNYLVNAYQATANKATFFNSFFSKLAGTASLQSQIESGMSAPEITQTWAKNLSAYNQMRQPYLLYP